MDPRIVDVVFARLDPHPWRRAGAAWVTAAAVAAAAAATVSLTRGPECECGVRVARVDPPTRLLAIETPPVETAAKAEPPPPAQQPDEPAPRSPSVRQAPPTFAQAASIVARQSSPNDPLDLTGEAFVTGSGPVFAGGLTAANGTSSAAIRQASPPPRAAAAPPPPRPRNAPDLSRIVGLPDPSWTCPWPAGAESESLDEQSAFLQVTVRPDGSVEKAVVLMDPGLGFGEAARRCAAAARFAPALDVAGVPVRALSPPIRVRFVR